MFLSFVKAVKLQGKVSEKIRFTGKLDIELLVGKLGVKLSLISPGNLEKEISTMLQCVAKKVNVETLILNVVSATCFVELGKSLKKVKGFN